MENKYNFMGIIIPVVIAVILLSVLPILINIDKDDTLSSDYMSSEPITSDDTTSEPISSDDTTSEPITSDDMPSDLTNVVVFKSDSARTITPIYTNTGITLQYSIDSGITWITIASGVTTPSAIEILFRGQATGTKSLFNSSDLTNAWSFSGEASNKLEVYGNLNFLLCDTLGDEVAPTSLADYSYSAMFYGCTSLTTAPSLPATTLADRCYQNMFRGCTSLTTAPSLPATTLAIYCYGAMFQDCTSLTTAPSLPATTLTSNCYRYMFANCTSFKVSTAKNGSYQYAWRIPTSGTGSTAADWNVSMLSNTGGTFTSAPTINTTYYVENPPV